MLQFRGTRCWTALAAGLLFTSVAVDTASAQGTRIAPLPRNSRDVREFERDFRDPRDVRDVRDGRDVRDIRTVRDIRDVRDPRDFRDPRQPVGVPIVPVNATSSISNDISGATAILEAAVGTMCQHIEPGREYSSNELIAYSDLRVLRLYAKALERSGWQLEQAYVDYLTYRQGGHYRDGYSHISDRKAQAAWERYRACRETARTLLLRVRTTAVSAEHQISLGDPIIGQEWRDEVLPALRDTIAAVEPILVEEVRGQRYSAYAGPGGRTGGPPVITTSAAGIPSNAVEVTPRLSSYLPYDGKGHGTGRYFEVYAYGGQIRVRSIRFASYDPSTGSTQIRDLTIDSIVEPGRPLYVACHRRRWVDASNIEITWESNSRNRVYGTIDLVESSPSEQNQPPRR